uniref:Uncharacterized protein n=1 Tax=Chromera velia CCMP2878 TaxID=1169474 RepID=A0A0G4FI09_9ALVE|eukprot:Cvel_3353.t1-p1 / transcript=Cvel_3353.t1 / gene=Cvel_3353 / organism=Chromera_velia_CCMP2878 / gene_product=hypothetical protein / transcript_product=hypothetical protein / location=Cvel_scaffold134:2578-4514(+) / protein_length=186 / sequence_SO=supercontig / SO=protein_coding / is_pseudo=false
MVRADSIQHIRSDLIVSKSAVQCFVLQTSRGASISKERRQRFTPESFAMLRRGDDRIEIDEQLRTTEQALNRSRENIDSLRNRLTTARGRLQENAVQMREYHEMIQRHLDDMRENERMIARIVRRLELYREGRDFDACSSVSTDVFSVVSGEAADEDEDRDEEDEQGSEGNSSAPRPTMKALKATL